MADFWSKEKRREYNHAYYMKHRDREIERAKKYQAEIESILPLWRKNEGIEA